MLNRAFYAIYEKLHILAYQNQIYELTTPN